MRIKHQHEIVTQRIIERWMKRILWQQHNNPQNFYNGFIKKIQGTSRLDQVRFLTKK